MSSTTLASVIITRARGKTDATTPTPSTHFVTDTELLLELNAAYKELIDLIADSSEAAIDLLAKTATLTTPYALPADYYRVLAVDTPNSDNGSPWREAQLFSFRQRNNYCDTANPAWRIMAGALVFAPANATPSSVRLWYVGVPATAVASDPLTTFNGWDNFVIGRLATYILEKGEQDPSPGLRMVKDASERIVSACARLVPGTTQRVERVEFFPEDYYDATSGY